MNYIYNDIASSNIDESWTNVKRSFYKIINDNIPKVKIKNEFQPPWFDAECFEACREKEHLRKRFKKSKQWMMSRASSI